MAILDPYQVISASGVKSTTVFEIDGVVYLAFPQFAEDIPGVVSTLDSGNSDVDVLIYKWGANGFQLYQSIPSHGSRNVSFFEFDGRQFIGISSLRQGGKEPYNVDSYSFVCEWDGRYFVPFQQFATRSCKNCYGFSVGSRHFLGLANGEQLDPNADSDADNNSYLYEWDGERFEEFQQIPSMAAFKWSSCEINGMVYLVLAENSGPSSVWVWRGDHFEKLQDLDQAGGREAYFFTWQDKQYLAFANLAHDSSLYYWDGRMFAKAQSLPGTGAHSYCFVEEDGEGILIQANYLGGTREEPVTQLETPIYQWIEGGFVEVDRYVNYGGTGVDSFVFNGARYVVQSNSHSAEIQFRVDSYVYRFVPPAKG